MSSYQEPEYYQEIPPGIQKGDIISGATISLLPTTTSEAQVGSLERCNSCGSMKRPLCSPQEPAPTKVSLHPAATSSKRKRHLSFEGSKEIPGANSNTTSSVPLPLSSCDVKQKVLDRSMSDITSYMETQETGEFKANASFQSPENSKTNVGSTSTSPAAASLPPLPLRRSRSDPTGSDFQEEATTTTPRPPAARTSIPSPRYGQESTNSKRLRRMKERIKEMSQWMEELVLEEDKDECICTGNDHAIDRNVKDLPQNHSHIEHEEAVWAERTRDGLVLHFKCPCNRGYEIFFSGKKCYYRVI